MIYIEKGSEPQVFLWYRKHHPDASFDTMPKDVKSKLRETLLKEQGHLCAYCMCRLCGEGDVKIEHFMARTPENELDYHNLLAVCMGGSDAPSKIQFCDSKKGDDKIFVNPLKRSDMDRIYYKNNGEIHSSDTTKYTYQYQDKNGKLHEKWTSPDQDLTETLNLNYENGAPFMGRNRALKTFQKQLSKYKDIGKKKTFLEKMRRKYGERSDERAPYIGILLWYIHKKLKQL